MDKSNDIHVTHTELSRERDSGYWHILSTKDVLKKWYLWNEHCQNVDRWHFICECEIWQHECTCRFTIWGKCHIRIHWLNVKLYGWMYCLHCGVENVKNTIFQYGAFLQWFPILSIWFRKINRILNVDMRDYNSTLHFTTGIINGICTKTT